MFTAKKLFLVANQARPSSSAGVFNSGGMLVRTLWGASINDPRVGNPAAAWDGLLDDGTVAPTGTYTIQVLSSNVGYTWEGVVGNSGLQPHVTTSYSMTYSGRGTPIYGGNYHTHGFPPTAMCITDAGEIYTVTQYDERIHTANVSTTADPQTNNTIIGNSFRSVWPNQNVGCATDGTKVYFAWQGIRTNGSAVWGIDVLAKTPSQLTSGTDEGAIIEGTSHVWGIEDYTDGGDSSNFITGLAVQKTGNFLFVTRSALSLIYSANKTTGAHAQSFTGFRSPSALATNPVTGDLWVIHQIVAAPSSPLLAAINFRGHAGDQATAKFASGSWTYAAPSGFSSLGAGVTFDPATATSGIVLSGGNLIATVPSSTANEYAYSTVTGSKIYFEIVVNVDPGGGNLLAIGISDNTTRTGSWLGDDAHSVGYFDGDGSVWVNALHVGTLPTYGAGDNIGIALDVANANIWFRKNGGNWNNSSVGNPVTGAFGISLVPVGGSLVNSVISKMTCDGSGNLTDSGLAISSVGVPANLAISPDGSTLLVPDAALASQQLKAFNTSDGSVKTAWASSGVLGVAGGYAHSPAVTSTKFMFADQNNFWPVGGVSVPLCFAPDGSFWLHDPANFRTLHFSSGNSPTYLEQRCSESLNTFSGWLCHNDDTRLFAAFLEYKIDYTKPLDGGLNGSWFLANNWFADRPPSLGADRVTAMRYTITGSNGRTYLITSDGTNDVWWEMTSSGLRNTGAKYGGYYVDRQFNLWLVSQVSAGAQVTYKKNAFTGFDGSNNPTWQTDPTLDPVTTVLTSQVLPTNFPPTGQNFGTLPSYMIEQLANGVIPIFDPDGSVGKVSNHIGGVDSSSGLVKFMGHPSTLSNRGGINTFLSYPESPTFDCAIPSGLGGNGGVGSNLGGSIFYKPGAVDFFTGYAGEGWGQNQTNVWYHWHESGLLIGRFGVAAPYFGRPMYLDGSFTKLHGTQYYLIPLAVTQITIAAWINPSVLDGNLRTIWGGFIDGGIVRENLAVTGSHVSFDYYNLHNITGGTIATGTWYRVVATVSGSGAALYINGTQVGTGPGSTLPTVNLDGFNIGSGTAFFGGAIADIAVWNTALSPSQITSLNTQRANTIGANANLVGYWPIQGTSIELDQSGSNNSPFSGVPTVAGPPGFPLFNGVNNALSLNGSNQTLSLFTDSILSDPIGFQSSWRGMPGLAGNAKWGGLAFQNGSYFIYQNDEWYHGGRHRWRIDGINSVSLSAPITVNWNSASYVPPGNGPPDLLASLPFNQANLPNGTGGWVRSPAADTTTPQLNVYTNAVHGWRFSTPDLVIQGANTSGAPTSATLSKSWTRAGSGNWSMNAEVVFAGGGESVNSRGIYIDILDNTAKRLLRMEVTRDPVNFYSGFYVNNTNIFPNFTLQNQFGSYVQGVPRPLTVSANVGGATMLVSYGDFSGSFGVLDVGADITKPSQFRLTWNCGSSSDTTYMGVSFTKLIFNV